MNNNTRKTINRKLAGEGQRFYLEQVFSHFSQKPIRKFINFQIENERSILRKIQIIKNKK